MCNKRRNEEIFNECAYSALMDKTNILKGVVGLLQTSSLHCKWSGLGKWRLHCLAVQLSLQSNNWAFSMQLWFLSPGTQGKEETGHSKWQSLSLNNMQLFTCHARRTNAGLPWKPRNILCKTMEMPMHSAFIHDYTQTVWDCVVRTVILLLAVGPIHLQIIVPNTKQ